MDIKAKLNQANGRLRAGKIGVIIEAKGDRLYLRATFPPKPNSNKQQHYQQRLALGFHANYGGISLAEAQARKIGGLLDCKEFSWSPYLAQKQELRSEAIADWIIKFEKHYFDRRARNPKSETTWKTDYLAVFRRLPQDQELTEQLLLEAILSTKPDTKTRKRFCMALQALATFADVAIDAKRFSGNYSPKQVTPRDLPDDKLIGEWFVKINNIFWRWVYGMIATFGLRPHEVFHLYTSELEMGEYIIKILDGKTGARRVWALYPEWVDLFELRGLKLPAVTGKTNSDLGHRCSQYFGRICLPFNLYDLRHCWAIRSLEFGLDISLAAAQMGHSVQVHTALYHHWISDRRHQRAFEKLMVRPDRPMPPILDS